MEEFSCPSECEEAEGKDGKSSSSQEKSSGGVTRLSVVWSGSAGKTPLILFRADAILGLDSPIEHPISDTPRLTFKISGEYGLVRTLLLSHGLTEVSWLNARFNIYWSGTHVQMSDVRRLMPHQRVNHFPRSYMITRKDKLYQNVSRMQQSKGMKHFNIIPTTFVLPEELGQFQVHFRKNRGVWIMKPVSSSRGRGITLINHPNQVNREEPMVVSRYIQNPLCVNGFKFDLRIYVAVTSFNPLKVYMYEEGLARFATEQYSGAVQLDNLCMHLTNYSVNKKSSQYVRCDSSDQEDYGSKWSMSALLRHLLRQGVNVTELMMKVEDVIIKALIAGESQISSACSIFQTHRGNCFELYGFDILIDEALTPWLLEINLSPSLGCDAPLDVRIKSNLIADLLTLVGVPLCNPNTRESPRPPKSRHHLHHSPPRTTPRQPPASPSITSSSRPRLTSAEVAMVRDCREEYQRRHGFVRIFPTHDSWDLYSYFLESKGRLNLILHQELYPGRIKSPHSPTPLSAVIAKRANVTLAEPPSVCDYPDGMVPLERVAVYLRRLESGAKTKPMWDSVCELLWPRDPPSLPVEPSTTETVEITDSPTHITEQLQTLTQDIEKLSKVQARKLFAAYLSCVQQRLFQETSDANQESQIAEDRANFEAVVRFLKGAAQSMSAPFTLVEPSTELQMKERKELLGRQLAEFITLYNQETVELAANPTEAHGMPAVILNTVLSNASEKELENLLEAYAQRTHSQSALFGPATHRPTTTTIKPAATAYYQAKIQHRCYLTSTGVDDRLQSSNRFARSTKQVSSRHSISRVLQRQSRLPRKDLSSARIIQHGSQSRECSPSERRLSPEDRQRTRSEVDCVPRTDTPLPYDHSHYSEELVAECYLSPGQKHSLLVLTQSLTAGSRGGAGRDGGVRGGLPPQGPRRKGPRGQTVGEGRRWRGSSKSGRLLRRTLSSQSLVSVSSEASVQSIQSVGLEPWTSIDTRAVSSSRPGSSSSLLKGYVSPYAVRKRPPVIQRRPNSSTRPHSVSVPRKKERAEQSHSKLSSAGEDSSSAVTEALQRLAMRQMTRQHTRSSVTTARANLTADTRPKTTDTRPKTEPYQSRLAWTRPRSANDATSDTGTN